MFSKELELSIAALFDKAHEANIQYITVEHLLLMIMSDFDVKEFFKSKGISNDSLKDDLNNHFSITFSSGYGSGVICPNTGMYFNNSLGEIELNPQGFLGDTKGDRLISNMSPLIIKTDDGITTIGSPGADRISSAIAQVLINYSMNNDWKQAIDAPRFHVNGDGTVRAEPGSLEIDKNITITEDYDMYFGGVCVSGLNKGVFSHGDKRLSLIHI